MRVPLTLPPEFGDLHHPVPWQRVLQGAERLLAELGLDEDSVRQLPSVVGPERVRYLLPGIEAVCDRRTAHEDGVAFCLRRCQQWKEEDEEREDEAPCREHGFLTLMGRFC